MSLAGAAERVSSDTAGLRASLERALAIGGRPVHRLGGAGTSVTFAVTGGESVTLLLDRRPPVVAAAGEPAESTVHLDPEQARQFARGELVLPNCLLTGTVDAVGPIRKYLALDPVMRALLARCR